MIGCLEGVFALGQVYVLISRVTDPKNFMLVGVPPKDLLEPIALELLVNGIDVDKYFEDVCSVTREWVYDKDAPRLKDRIKVKFNNEHSTPVKLRQIEEILNPQPDAQVVFHRLLDWMDRVDLASQSGSARPAFQTPDGEDIFPPEEELWWLTDISRRAAGDKEEQQGDEDGPPSEIEEEAIPGQEVSDEDPVSSDGAGEPLSHNPVVAWRP